MKLITRDTDYAIRALCFIAQHKKKITSVTELVASLKIPRPFLRKILQILNKESILNSHKGKGGGFELALKPEQIFLLNLTEVFQGPLRLNECLFKKSLCPNVGICKFKRKLDKIQDYAILQLKNVTLATLVKGSHG